MKRAVTIGISVIFITGVALFSTFHSTSVCSICGCRSRAVDFEFPFVPVTYWRHRRTEETPLSIAMQRLYLIGPHSHEWKLNHGSGNGIMCALGSGSGLDRNARSETVVSFITDTNRYRGSKEAAEWCETALHDRKSRAVHDWLQFQTFPDAGCDSVESYTEWRKKADQEWPETVKRNSL